MDQRHRGRHHAHQHHAGDGAEEAVGQSRHDGLERAGGVGPGVDAVVRAGDAVDEDAAPDEEHGGGADDGFVDPHAAPAEAEFTPVIAPVASPLAAVVALPATAHVLSP